MGFRLQIVAAAITLTSAVSGAAFAVEGPIALRLAGGWTAKLFVEPMNVKAPLAGEAPVRRDAFAINARVSRPVGKRADLSLEATNLLDRDSPASQGLAPPDTGRGVLLRFRKSF